VSWQNYIFWQVFGVKDLARHDESTGDGRGENPEMSNKRIISLGTAALFFLCVLGGVFYQHHRVSLRKPIGMMGMSRDEYQGYQLEHQHLLFENERLIRQLKDLEQAVAHQDTWLNKVKEENLQLRDKILLMNRLVHLQQSIFQLKEQEIQDAPGKEGNAGPGLPQGALSWATLDEARATLEKAKIRIRSVQERMKVLVADDEAEQLAIQEEMDRVQSLIGNKGYLFRGSAQVSGEGAL